jgi:hypothetical protein
MYQWFTCTYITYDIVNNCVITLQETSHSQLRQRKDSNQQIGEANYPLRITKVMISDTN